MTNKTDIAAKTREEEAYSDANILARLADHPKWVLFWAPWDGNPKSESFWLLHGKIDGTKDNGLDLIGYGRTPADVLRRALMEEDILSLPRVAAKSSSNPNTRS